MSEQPIAPIQIRTTAPIPAADLKRKFTEDIQFVIDVDNSRLKGRAFLTYLSNLNINCKLEFQSNDALFALLGEYLASTLLVKVPDLEDLAMNVMLAASGRQHVLAFDPSEFIDTHADAINTWLKRLCSLPLFALYCQPQFKEEIEQSFPEDTDESTVGINFVRLIEHDFFPLMMAGIDESEYSWNKTFFNEYIFAGDNLFKFFASMNNPFFVGILGSQCPDEFQAILPPMQSVLEKTSLIVKEIEHVSSSQ